MEPKARTLFNNSLIYGLLTAAISIVFSVITYLLDLQMNNPVMYFSFVILLAGIIYGTMQYKNVSLGGYISFGKAFLSGFLIVLIASVISSIYSYIFLTFIDHAYLERIIQQSMDKAEADMVKKGLSGDQIEPALAIARKFMSPIAMSAMAILSSAFFGAILSLITAAFVKKEDKSFDGQFKDVE